MARYSVVDSGGQVHEITCDDVTLDDSGWAKFKLLHKLKVGGAVTLVAAMFRPRFVSRMKEGDHEAQP